MTTRTAPEQVESTTNIEKLTDDAITKRIAALGRQIKTQEDHRDEAQANIDALRKEKTMLIQAKIDRLTAQLPAVSSDVTGPVETKE